MARIRITAASVSLLATTRDTPTARKILAALPLRSRAQTWGEEVYFNVAVESPLEAEARDVVEPGELAFWVEGSCIAIGFGPTPISQGDEIRLAARTNIWADTEAEAVKQLAAVQAGDAIHIERLG